MLICTLQTQTGKALTIIVLRFSRKKGVGTKDDGRGSSGNDDGPSLDKRTINTGDEKRRVL